MRTLWMVVVVLLVTGCSRRQKMTVFPAGPITVTSPAEGDKECVDRLLARSRFTGYIEQTVDKQAQFFRVLARHREFSTPLDRRGRPQPFREAAPGKAPAFVQFYNVQCVGPETAIIMPMNERGPLADGEFVMDPQQYNELNQYARQLGAVPVSAAPPPPAPAHPEESAAAPRCVASELPEWQGASAAEKKKLLEQCRAPAEQ